MTDDPYKAFAPPDRASLATVTVQGPVCFVKVLVPTVASVEAPALGNMLRETLEAAEGARYMVLDLTDVRMLSSAALGMLVSTYTSAMSRGTTVILTDVAEPVLQVLQVTKLTTVLKVCKTSGELEQALRG